MTAARYQDRRRAERRGTPARADVAVFAQRAPSRAMSDHRAADRPRAALTPTVALLGTDRSVRRLERTLGRAGLDVVATVDDVQGLRQLSESVHPHVLVVVGEEQLDPAILSSVSAWLPHTRVVVTVDGRQVTAVRRAVQAGADGVVLDSDAAMSIAVVVQAVSLGHAVVPLNDRSVLLRQRLSTREREILALAAEGLTKSEISAQLHLAESTVKSHLSSGFSKIGVHSQAELSAYFSERHEGRSTDPSVLSPGDPA